jgi:gluconokinase
MSAAESPAQRPAQQPAQQSGQQSAQQSVRQSPVLVVMGVSGSGKSTVGAAIAQRLRVPFGDADDFHPPANIAKMAAGQALDDDDRGPWLVAIGRWLAGHPDGGVMSCSALKRKYRDELRRHAPRAEFLHLQGSPEVIGRRQASRPGHFMPASLLASQFATLEPLQPAERGEVVDVDQSIDAIVQQYVDRHAARTDEPAPRNKEK